MYGFKDKDAADKMAERLRNLEPDNKFEVTPHSWLPGFPTRLSNGEVNALAADKWGVVRWSPYCEKVSWRNTGFVWFSAGDLKPFQVQLKEKDDESIRKDA